MPEEEREKLNRIEDIKKKLFTKSFSPRNERHDTFYHKPNLDVQTDWQEEEIRSVPENKIFMKTSIFKKFFILSIIFFILALGYGAYMFFVGGNTVSNNNIEIAVLGNTFTAGGEELPLQIEVTNRNNSALELADLLIEYPKSSDGDLSGELERVRSSLGTVEPGAIKTENVKLVIFGEQGSVRPIRISLEYRVTGSNAIFVKEKPFEVSISSAPINLLVDAPVEASPNQEITFNLKAILNANKPVSKILVKMDYPVGFEFSSATPAPSFGNNVWNLGDLAPGAEKQISVTGKMVEAENGEDKVFHVFSGSQSSSDKSSIETVFSSLGHTIAIKRPFIEAKLFVNGVYQREYSNDSKNPISAEVRWANNLDTKINDLEIKAKVTGNALNKNKINANAGFYNSSIDTIVWDKNSQSQFAEINPGDSGSVSFTLGTLPLFASGSGIMSNPSVNIEVSISGKQAIDGNVLKELKNSETKVVKIISDMGLANKALYYSGPFSNTGPIPPKAGEETTYTVVWTLSNTSNNISNIQVKATLPQWVKFIDKVSPQAEQVKYDASNREISWNVGSMPRGAGITGASREVSFQIAFTPSLSQVGTTPVLMNDTTLTGHDDFANVDVRLNKQSLNTRLSNDASFPGNGDRVIE